MTTGASPTDPAPRDPPFLRRRWLLLPLLVLLLGAAAAAALWRASTGKPEAASSLDGKLTVLVRPPGRTNEPVSVEQPGALPVIAGGAMYLDAHFNQPAFAYLVWLDSEGQVLPLYPWNNETLEVKDINQPPPVRRATNLIFSPLLGRDWPFGRQSGAETVLLLARRTPLPESTRLGPLFNPLPPQPTSPLPKEPLILALDAKTKSITTLAPSTTAAEYASSSDDALRTLLLRLSDHFELIQAVRFPHKS